MDRAIVHQVGEKPVRFSLLSAALRYCSERKITGYIAVWSPSEGTSVIDVKNGKRPGAKKGTWVPCQ